jgi:putative transferase (TIGR04331 family)
MFLITTADQRFWKTDEPVLFLGEWCKLYSQRHIWSKMDAVVAPYHWDDRGKLYRDYCKLSALYERILVEVADRLNEIHHVNHSLRYWRILIGPWLGYFIQMVFDRWEMIQSAVKHYKISGARVIDGDLSRLVPNDMDDFHRLFLSDQWNQAIYGYLLEHWTDVNCEHVTSHSPDSTNIDASYPQVNIKRRIKRFIARIANKVLAACVRQNEAFFIGDNLPVRQSFALQWRLGQLPRLWRMIATPPVAVNSESRRWFLRDSSSNIFEQALRTLIPLQMPTAYLEGYGDLKKQVTRLPWPQCPRFIFTSYSYIAGEVFKAWAAMKVEAGVPFIIGQHGGASGIALWSFAEDHQLAISDAWLSWGWEDVSNNKIKPVGNLKMIGRRLRWDPDGYALLVEMAVPRYSYHMFSGTVASQWLGYFDDQSRFVDAMPQNLREKLLVRLYSQDRGWCVKQRWQDRFPQIRLDEGVKPIASLIKKSRLYISTYNATTFLESLAMNIPTIMFWNQKHWELRTSAQPYFDRLQEVGIFHETPESAAAKVVEVWDDIYNWWHQSKIQEARLYFCNRFSRMSANPLRVLHDTLTAVNTEP